MEHASRLLGLGASQVLARSRSSCSSLGARRRSRAALVAAMALSLSSTALALQPLPSAGARHARRPGDLRHPALPDLAVIPMLP